MTFSLRSSAFSKGEPIPAKYTADGENLSPPLEWSDPPAGTKSFALIVEDPDTPSGMFRHWGLYNIMGERTLLPEGVGHGPKTEKLGKGVNDFGEPRYGGPAPRRRATEPITITSSSRLWMSRSFRVRQPCRLPTFGKRPKGTCLVKPSSLGRTAADSSHRSLRVNQVTLRMGLAAGKQLTSLLKLSSI